MRKVIVFNRVFHNTKRIYENVESSRGFFHGWGLDIEEGASGFASYSVAIVEQEDGTIITPAAHMVMFIEPTRE